MINNKIVQGKHLETASVTPATKVEKKRNPSVTLDSTQKVEARKSVKLTFDRPKLLEPKKQSHDVMRDIAEAFSRIYSTMAEGVALGTNDYANISTMSRELATRQLNATEKEVHLSITTLKKQSDAANLGIKIGNWMTPINVALSVAGVVLIGLTIAAAIPTGGLSLLALPEEVGGEVVGEAALEMTTISTEEVVTDASGEITSTLVEDTTEAVSSGVNEISEELDEEVSTSAGKVVGKAGSQVTKGGIKKALMTAFKKLTKMTLHAAFSAPQVVTGIVKLTIAEKLTIVSEAEKKVGAAEAVLQMIGGSNKFFQTQERQEMSGILGPETTELGEVISTYGKTTHAMQDIISNVAV